MVHSATWRTAGVLLQSANTPSTSNSLSRMNSEAARSGFSWAPCSTPRFAALRKHSNAGRTWSIRLAPPSVVDLKFLLLLPRVRRSAAARICELGIGTLEGALDIIDRDGP